jgi:hypothetical protein
VQHGFLNPGDELRLDAVRFILVAPGMEIPNTTKESPATKVLPGDAVVSNRRMQLMAMGLTFIALAIVAALLVMKGAGKG